MKTGCLWSVFVLLLLSSARGAAQFVEPETLSIKVERGTVFVEAEGVAFTPGELSALRNAIHTRLSDSPFRQQGTIELKLRGQAVRTLKGKLDAVDLADTEAVRRALDDFSDDYLARTPGPGGKSLTEPVKVVIGQAFTLAPDSPVASLVAIGSHGVVEGHLAELVAIGSDVRLGPHATVSKNLFSIGSRLDLDPGAQSTAQETWVSLPEPAAFFTQWTTPRQDARIAWGAYVTWAIVTLLLSLGFGVLYLRLFPQTHEETMARLAEQPWRALGFGVLHYVAILPVALLLVFTVIGILFLPVYFVAVGLALWMAYVASAVWIGKVVFSTNDAWKQLAAGLVLLKVAGLLPVVGTLVAFALTAFGLGALAQVVYRMGRRPTPTDQSPLPHAQPAT